MVSFISFISLGPDLRPVSVRSNEAALLLFVRKPHQSSPDTVRLVTAVPRPLSHRSLLDGLNLFQKEILP